jgi:hypothetical protein
MCDSFWCWGPDYEFPTGVRQPRDETPKLIKWQNNHTYPNEEQQTPSSQYAELIAWAKRQERSYSTHLAQSDLLLYNLDQLFANQFFKQFIYILPAPSFFDIVFIGNVIRDLRDSMWLIY